MGEITLKDKLNNFPFVVYITLEEFIERGEFMESQLNKYEIPHKKYLTKRLSEMTDVIVHNSNIPQLGTGICISHLNAMRWWYENSTDEYVIVCEDDHSFESIDYWEFTWDEFMSRLPFDWECVQLIRIISPAEDYSTVDILQNLSILSGRWWGGASLMRRSYVKKLLDRHVVDDKTYNLFVQSAYLQSLLENILYVDAGIVYNFPMLVEKISLDSTSRPPNITDEEYAQGKMHHIMSRNMIIDCWEKSGKLKI